MGAHESANQPDRETRIILDSLRRMVRALRLFDRQAEKATGLSGAQLFVLQKLGDGEPISINELARRTHTDQSSVSVVAQKLAKRRLVKRVPVISDRRRVDVHITAKGTKLLKSGPAAAQESLIAAITDFEEAERTKLAELLGELIHRTGMGVGKAGLFFEDKERS